MAREKSNIKERFYALVSKQPGENGCWRWTGALSDEGYSKFWVSDEIGTVLGHRWAYMMSTGKLIEGDAVLDHQCKNHWCVRPSHLTPETGRMNTMRGESDAARNARKDHCAKGHPFSPDNTYRNKRGGRQCRICMRIATQRYSRSHPDRAVARMRRFRERRG